MRRVRTNHTTSIFKKKAPHGEKRGAFSCEAVGLALLDQEGHALHVFGRVHLRRRLLRADRDDLEVMRHCPVRRGEVEVHEDELTLTHRLLDELELAPRRPAVLGELLDERALAVDVDVGGRSLGMVPEAVVEVGTFDGVRQNPLEVVLTEAREDELHHHRLLVRQRVPRIPAENGLVDRAFVDHLHCFLLCAFVLVRPVLS